MTTAEGARGVDIKNPAVAHVQINYAPPTVSETVQACGRGSRSLESHTTATILCRDPVTESPANYLKVLENKNHEFGKDLYKYTKCAMLVHGKMFSTDSQEYITLCDFEDALMGCKTWAQLAKDKNTANLWSDFRKQFDTADIKTMPGVHYGEWKK